MYPAIWFLTFVVVPFVSASTACLFSSKLWENFSGKRVISSLAARLICSVLTFPKCYAPLVFVDFLFLALDGVVTQ
jgi:hypothetical protein